MGEKRKKFTEASRLEFSNNTGNTGTVLIISRDIQLETC